MIHAGGDSKHFSISFHIAKQTLEVLSCWTYWLSIFSLYNILMLSSRLEIISTYCQCYAPSVEDATAICKVLHEIAVAEAQMTVSLLDGVTL